MMRDGRLDRFGRIRVHPLVLDAEAEKRPQPFELLPGRDRGNLPGLAIQPHLVDRGGCDRPPLKMLLELFREELVFADGGVRELARLAIADEGVAGFRNESNLRRVPRFPITDQFLSGFPVAEVEGLLQPLAVERALHPDRTPALFVGPRPGADRM